MSTTLTREQWLSRRPGRRKRGPGTYPPYFTGVPLITGTATTGQTLTAVGSPRYGQQPIVDSWQWFRDGVAIDGADEQTYTLVLADEGADITIVQTATDPSDRATASLPSLAVVPTA